MLEGFHAQGEAGEVENEASERRLLRKNGRLQPTTCDQQPNKCRHDAIHSAQAGDSVAIDREGEGSKREIVGCNVHIVASKPGIVG